MTHRINKRTQQSETVYPNRTPTRSEVFAHAPILDYELMKVQPKLIATLGNIGLRTFTWQRIYGYQKSWSTLYRACLTINRTKGCLRMVRKKLSNSSTFSSSSYFLQSLPCTCYPSRLASTSFTFTAILKRTDKTIKSSVYSLVCSFSLF